MSVPFLQEVLYLVAAASFGGFVVWLIRGRAVGLDLDRQDDEWQARLDAVLRKKEQLLTENKTLHASLEAERRTMHKHQQAAIRSRTEIDALREKAVSATKDLFVASEERDELIEQLFSTKVKLDAAKQQIADQQIEFDKGREYYKSQIEGAVDQRKALEGKVEEGKSEHESLRNLLMEEKAEHESVSSMLSSAQSQLQKLDELERQFITVEAKNSELRQLAMIATSDNEALQQSVAEMDALRVQNRELAHCLQSMESSRKQYEDDARRYRSQYEKSDQETGVLRSKLDHMEKSWEERRRQQDEAQCAGLQNDGPAPAFGMEAPQGDLDDLTEIIGVGKVFAATLHRLGIYQFRQIASFGSAELAHVNAELKEFRGRIERDDWIGQAKELHFRKYGSGGE